MSITNKAGDSAIYNSKVMPFSNRASPPPDFMLLRCRVKSFEDLFLESIRVLVIQHLFHYYVDNVANAANPSLSPVEAKF